MKIDETIIPGLNSPYESFTKTIRDIGKEIVSSHFGDNNWLKPILQAKEPKKIFAFVDTVGRNITSINYSIPSADLYKKYPVLNNKIYLERPTIYWLTRYAIMFEHECSHIKAIQTTFSRTLSKRAMFASMVDMVCTFNYGFEESNNGTGVDMINYSRNINEILAEHDGLVYGKKFILRKFPQFREETIDDVILTILNDKIREHKGYYLLSYGTKEPIHSYSEIIKRYRQSIKVAYTLPFPYDIENNKNTDELARWMSDYKDKELIESVLNEIDPIKQIKGYSTFCYQIWGELIPKTYPSLQYIDFSLENIFEPLPYFSAINKSIKRTTIDTANKIYEKASDIADDVDELRVGAILKLKNAAAEMKRNLPKKDKQNNSFGL